MKDSKAAIPLDSRLFSTTVRDDVPTLVPKPGSPTVTQEHLPSRKSDALRFLGLPWVMLDREIYLLKIRVSAVQPSRPAATDARSASRRSLRSILPLATILFNL